ncbi:hypothetical protein GCM10022378_14480 [Salinicoccus jeotgali]|uniref:TetR family transcriptional regulator n=1 Tax=Salinicoccus jeotgali TaxID=381634 RepID=A0ABP7EYK0_9STAP
MDALRKELISDLGYHSHILDIHNDPFFDFFSDNAHTFRNPHVNQAVLFFNTALNFLDTPSDDSRELGVLVGDYLFSKFYLKLAEHEEYEVLHDMMNMSKSLSSTKSEVALKESSPQLEELKWLLYGPMLYLIKHGYADDSLNDVIDEQIENLDITSLPYINHK